MPPTWISAFLDFAPETFEDGVRFWSEVTQYDVSAPRGDGGEFATLVPPDGDDFLRVQRLADGADRIHLDLHVEDPRAATERAVALGATEVADLGHVVMRSPGGFDFCFVDHPAATRPRPSVRPGGHASLPDQVCLDVPAASYDEECAFWRDLTGWDLRGSDYAEFRSLARPVEQPVRLLLQRLEEETGDVRGHLDWSTTNRAAETERHVGAGATVVDVRTGWTVLADPHGRRYCLTDRHPGSVTSG